MRRLPSFRCPHAAVAWASASVLLLVGCTTEELHGFADSVNGAVDDLASRLRASVPGASVPGVPGLAGAAAPVVRPNEGDPEPGSEKTLELGTASLALRWCPAGEFTMGSSEEETMHYPDEVEHRVTLTKGFWMGETEVVQGLWKEVVGTPPPAFHKGDDLPLDNATLAHCRTFLDALNARPETVGAGLEFALPTEAEWEWACRALSMEPWAGTGKMEDMGWDADTSGNRTHPAGEKAPNAWGLKDMHGNVWERCSDWFADYPAGPATDPVGPDSGKEQVVRGGCFGNDPFQCRSARRGSAYPDQGSGLRVIARARPVPAPADGAAEAAMSAAAE